jgi:hypothetical protein
MARRSREVLLSKFGFGTEAVRDYVAEGEAHAEEKHSRILWHELWVFVSLVCTAQPGDAQSQRLLRAVLESLYLRFKSPDLVSLSSSERSDI